MLGTPLEARGYGEPIHTSKGEEAAFLLALGIDSPRVNIEQIGGGEVDGTPIFLACLGEPGPAFGTTDSILVVGYQHDGEYATREAIVKFVRDLDYTTDPNLASHLAAHPAHVIVTANPDRIRDWPLCNQNGVNLNRDHLALAATETRLIHKTINRVRPSTIVDIHENDVRVGGIQFGYPTEYLML